MLLELSMNLLYFCAVSLRSAVTHMVFGSRAQTQWDWGGVKAGRRGACMGKVEVMKAHR